MAVFTRRLMLAALAASSLAACERGGGSGAPARAAFEGIDITGADYARELELPDADGQPRHIADFRGKVTVVFFGYTQCPDVCPTTMVELAEVKRQLGPAGERVQGVFVSVDPERDTPELLKAYVANFDPSFVALRGTPEQVKTVAKQFKVFYNKVPGQTPTSYTIDHTAGSYVFDGQGRVRLFTRYGAGIDKLKHDLQILLAEQAA
ncbi:SCO family protein [Rubrivivax gelatinosus]|uniref:SCO family protein n=1 Tax=Rubrivivax gelatinosus TaxID=28068 RepID=A0ABS1DQE6_RUBGE|nr:SCO family protein [Rubrivivax gelatinosus]MBK1614682.1 SCO family protein [Rubrivivax gelatinosus]MBK1712224.1 SCO family protein [Rubrivivax gelatinosus]